MVSAPPPCFACGGSHAAPLAVDAWTIATCAGCGTGRLWPDPTAAELDAAYRDDYYGGSSKFIAPLEQVMRTLAQREAAALAKTLPDGHRCVLDVGCGRGVLANALVRLGVQVTGVERSHAATAGLDPRVEVVTGQTLRDAGLSMRQFGAVVFRHVLEHLDDPLESLIAARELTADGGTVRIEVPDYGSRQARLFGEHWLHLDAPRHLHHFTDRGLLALTKRAGLRGRILRRSSVSQDGMGWLQSALALVGRPGQGLVNSMKSSGPRSPIDLGLATLLLPAAAAMTALDVVADSGGVLVYAGHPGARP